MDKRNRSVLLTEEKYLDVQRRQITPAKKFHSIQTVNKQNTSYLIKSLVK